MNRKQFLKKSLQAGLCCCGAALGFGYSFRAEPGKAILQDPRQADEGWIPELEKRMIKGAETPAWRKVEKSGQWIKALMEHMDAMLSKEVKARLLQECGRSCFIRAFGVADANRPALEEKEYLRFLESSGYKVQREGRMISFIYSWGRNHQNPQGLMLQDGYCMCPIVESGPPGLSPTYCYCSTGYVKEGFERRIGKAVKVELLDSLKMGGKDCIFKLTIYP
jgi:hypothetical protein